MMRLSSCITRTAQQVALEQDSMIYILVQMKTIKASKKLINSLLPFWQRLNKYQSDYRLAKIRLEIEMSEKLKMKDLTFFEVDGDVVGVGNESRTLHLISIEEIKSAK